MGRASTKSDLLAAASEQFEKMWRLIDAMPQEEQQANFLFGDSFAQKEAHWERDKNLRDVLIHLYEWHMLLLNWIESNQNGQAKSFIPEPYNWRTYGQMNIEFCEKHQHTSLEIAKEQLKHSHANVVDMIDSFSNEQLFTKNVFAWTGTSTLGSYCVSATSSHYEWAIKKIKAHNRTYKK